MKTKKLFKIGVLSIILLSLLISPNLLLNTAKEAQAKIPLDANAEYCGKPPEVHTGEDEIKIKEEWCNKCCEYKGDDKYGGPIIESIYDWKDQKTQEGKNNVCYGTCRTAETMTYLGYESESEGTTTTVGILTKEFTESKAKVLETSPKVICGALEGESKKLWEPGWIEYQLCLFQKGIVEGTGKMIAGIINAIVGWIVWALNPATYGGFVNNQSVRDIWEILRDYVNLALVLILVFIAIATILGIKKYRWQETLGKLIAVALLVNFSLVIPGIMLDISHFVTYTFLNLAKLDNDNFATSITALYQTEKISSGEKYAFTLVDEADQAATKGWAYSWGNFLLCMIVLIFLGIFSIITLIAIFVTMIFRSGLILMLLCVAPFAFAAWVLPATAGLWKAWWNQFIKWSTFPIIFSVTLYMGITVLNSVNKIDFSTINAAAEAAEKVGPITTCIHIFLFSVFLIGGLIFSVQSGGAISKTVQTQGSKLVLGAGALLGRKIKGGIVESPTYAKAGQALTSVPLLRGVGQEMLVAGEKTKAARVKEYEKELEQVSLGALKQLEKVNLPSKLEKEAYEKRIALVNKLADMGELGKNSLEFIKRNKDDVRFNKKAIAEAVPHYFKIEEGELVDTGDDIKNKVMALSRIKPDKIRDKTQISDFIENTVDDKKAIAAKEGKTEEEQKAIGEETFEKIIQETVKTLSPAQLAGWWKGISPKYMTEKGWGGKEGKIIKAIEKDPEAKKKFYGEAIPTSLTLREASGVGMPQENKGSETPPHSGWVKKGGVWQPPEA
ncbi:MAG: hypothetical protein PHF45_01125 [Candidatus Pacebacteria bacterium]|nr:hypothetical protein [Candidatus Paceibacterota bacterium]